MDARSERTSRPLIDPRCVAARRAADDRRLAERRELSLAYSRSHFDLLQFTAGTLEPPPDGKDAKGPDAPGAFARERR
jgi:hypothetical protein